MALVFLAFGGQGSVCGQLMFWTDTFGHKVERASTDGSNRFVLHYTSAPRGIAINLQQERVYWTDERNDDIERISFDGTGHEVLVTGVDNPRGIALDFTAQKMYWVERSADRVRRADFDGQNVEIVIDVGLVDPLQVALDPVAGHLYISDAASPSESQGRLLRANLDGTNLVSLVEGLGDPTGLALDLNGGAIYWADNSLRNIARANLDGSNIEMLVSTELVSPLGIALDIVGAKIYWTDAGSGTPDDGRIQRSNLDGSSVETLLNTKLNNPRDIALDVRCSSLPNGTPCENFNPCDDNDQCMDGNCIGAAVPGSCDDLDRCTVSDTCVQGACVGTLDPSACFHFALVVTEVNGVPCPSCPTSELPEGEALPGDVLTIEAYLENWDNGSGIGRCENGNGCNVAAQDCPFSHCFNQYGLQCASDAQCGADGPCVPDLCLPYPTVAAYEWTVDPQSLASGLAGELGLRDVPCSSQGDCDNGPAECTCDGAACIGSTCEVRGTYFIDQGRPDFIFANAEALVLFSGNPSSRPSVAAIHLRRGAVDPGSPVYLGTLRLKVSTDARGTFVVDVVRHLDYTLINDENVEIIGLDFISPATIDLCDVLDLSNDCNSNEIPDECEVDGDGDGIIDACDPCPNDATNDSDGDGVCDSADGCPLDANKTLAGVCGCGEPDSGDADGDQVLDCIDQCPGINNQIFGNDCVSAIPAVSTWGLVILALLMMTGAKAAFQRPQGV